MQIQKHTKGMDNKKGIGKRKSKVKLKGKIGDRSSLQSQLPTRKKVLQNKLYERQKLAREILHTQRIKYIFKDVTAELAAVPGMLELHPTAGAPTLTEIETRLAREQEHERLKYFSVPIRLYNPDEHKANDLSLIKFTEKDRVELNLYGSRVVMRNGRVTALEVEQSIMEQFKHKQKYVEICQCVEKEYEVSEGMRTNQKTRRIFMAKVLLLEILLRLPSLLVMHYQKESTQLHDFIYQQTLLIFFMIAIVQGTRLAGIYFSEVGRFEPCRTIITILTVFGYCMISVLATALIQQASIYYVEFRLYEDPVSLETLKEKKRHLSGLRVSYPYIVGFFIFYLTVINATLSVILLICPKRAFNELGNSFILVVIVASVLTTIALYFLIFSEKFSYFTTVPLGWDGTQLMFSFLIGTKWAIVQATTQYYFKQFTQFNLHIKVILLIVNLIFGGKQWRFYMLQAVVKGKSLKVKEELYQFVSLNFAF